MNSFYIFMNILCAVIIMVLLLIVAAMHKKLLVDELTGLKNRTGLLRFLEKRLRKLGDGEVLVVSMIDLDDFKNINDTRGHVEGDRCLAEFAGVLRKVCRDDAFLARYGGDEFVIAGKEDLEEMVRKASDLRFSMGTVKIDGHEKAGAEEVISRADRAMYDAKKKR